MKRIITSGLVLLSTTFVVAEDLKSVEKNVAIADLNSTKSIVEEKAVDVKERVNISNPRAINTAFKLGTLGLGFDISTPINDKLSARFNLNGASYTDTQEEDDNEFEGTLDLLTAGVLLDYYPFENNFRLTTGAYYNGNGFTGNIKPSPDTSIDINGKEYGVGDIGSLDTDISFDKIAPYIGLGWGNDARDKGWGFTFDLGVMYHGEGEGTLTPKDVSPLVDRDLLDENVKKEEQDINDDLAKIKLYPVIAIGVNYSF